MLTEIANALNVPQFLILALSAGFITSLVSAYYGVFVVQRGLGFLGNGLAHAAFGGVALGIMLNTEPLLVALPFTILVAVGITWLQGRASLGADTAIGIFFSLSMALGIVFLSQTDHYSTDAFSYLFGSILAVRPSDLWAAMGVLLLTLCTLPFWGRWAFATFDRELARSEGLPCRFDDYLLAICLSIAIVVSMKIVGIVLIAAFLVIPPATARLLARTFRGMTMLALAFSGASVFLGMYCAYQMDWPAGASIILVQSLVFGVVLLFTKR